MNKKGVSEVVSAVLLISMVIVAVLTFSYFYTNFLFEKEDQIEGTVFEEIGLGCNPAYDCSEWSPCVVEWNFGNLIPEDLQLSGITKRNCVDSTGCVPEKTEEQACSNQEPITIEVFEEEGTTNVQIKDQEGNIISEMDKDEETGTLYVNLYL